jgi:hypothetical protein
VRRRKREAERLQKENWLPLLLRLLKWSRLLR